MMHGGSGFVKEWVERQRVQDKESYPSRNRVMRVSFARKASVPEPTAPGKSVGVFRSRFGAAALLVLPLGWLRSGSVLYGGGVGAVPRPLVVL